ncbi:MAG TPA: S8/S53 family peptidase [Ignavibacteria bacterium]|nr:S8/S53 family peptidase [Ignavibacteria bacterium]
MKKFLPSIILLILIAAFALSFKPPNDKIGPRLMSAMDNTSNNIYVVWVYFSDKGSNVQSKLSNPLSLVSQKSIDRRSKVKSPGELVDFTDAPLNNEYVNIISGKVNKLRHKTKWLNAVSIEATKDQIDLISKYYFITKIELVEQFTYAPDNIEYSSNDSPVFENGTGFDPMADTFSYGTGNAVTQITQIKVNLVHNQGIHGQGVLIASFDAGFSNLTHEAFTTYPMRIKSTYDFETNSPVLTGNSHGTATLCLVGGYKPGKMIGPAYGSSFILARTEVTTWERPVEMDHWIAAAEWADSLGADVITSSLGYLGFDPGYQSWTWQDMNGNTLPVTIAADLAVNKGIIVSNSAGNSGNNSHNTLGAPADGDSVISVGAVTSTGSRSSFSSVGPTTDNPPRIKPDVMAMGSSNYYASTSGNNYTSGSGTSFSCPLTAGVCALVLSANKNLTPLQVRGILRKFASQSSNPDNLMGWGIIDASQSVDSARKLDNTAPLIQHTLPFASTTNTGIITMKSRITDNGIIRNWTNEAPRLYFRKTTNGGINWTSYTAANYSYYNNNDSFFFDISGSAIGTRVEYYIAAQDIALPTPKMSTLPAGGSGINPPGTTAPPTRLSYYVGFLGIEPVSNEIPGEFKLYNNYPNPFNPETKIRFDIPPLEGDRGRIVMLNIYDILGREVQSLVNEELKPGAYEISFNASNLSSGIYFYKITSGIYTDVKKMMIVK